MIYLLDTNTCIAYIHRRNQSVGERLKALSPDEVVLCQTFSIHKLGQERLPEFTLISKPYR